MNLIRGEYFPSIANRVLVHYDELRCNPNDIQDGDIVYCDTHHIVSFKDVLNTRSNLTIVTHNSDHCLSDVSFGDSKIVNVNEFSCWTRWFGQNSFTNKVTSIPIGFENMRWESCFGPKTDWIFSARSCNTVPSKQVYLNCNKTTYYNERQRCYDIAHQMDFVNIDTPMLTYEQYLRKIQDHKFVLSPRGNGLDCHRTWEILMLKRVPILKREGSLESLYKNMPVLFVDDWTDLNNMNLDEIFEGYTFDDQSYLTFEFWQKMVLG